MVGLAYPASTSCLWKLDSGHPRHVDVGDQTGGFNEKRCQRTLPIKHCHGSKLRASAYPA